MCNSLLFIRLYWHFGATCFLLQSGLRTWYLPTPFYCRNVMAHGNAREGKWRGNWRMDWVASTLHTTSEHGVSSITTADAHTSAASSRLNWRPRQFKLTRPFPLKTKSSFCACAITFQLASSASSKIQLKCDDTWWRTGREVKGKLVNGVGSQYSSHQLRTWCIQHYYRWCVHLGRQ